MKMKNYFILLFTVFALVITSCKKPEPEPEPVPVVESSTIKGEVTYFDDESGNGGAAPNAIIRLHKGLEQGAIKEVTTDSKGLYEIKGIARGIYTVSAEFKLPEKTDPFSIRSDSIIIEKHDTYIRNIHME